MRGKNFPKIYHYRYFRLSNAVLMLLIGSLLVSATPIAQRRKHTDKNRPGSCCKAPGFQLDQLPPPVLMKGIGNSSLKITTKSEKAQEYFNQGLNLLHCFWEFEAYRAFKEAARLDSNCAMAYWGIYMALPDGAENQQKRRVFLKKAVALINEAGEQEQLYIKAYEKLELSNLEDDEAEAQFNRGMESLIDRYPEDNQARLFYAYSLMSGYDADGDPREHQIYSQTLLANLLLKEPDSAAANHYWIHAMEDRHPEAALTSANRLAALAPNSGHIVHMPGHIYYRLGEYERARAAFLASMQVDKEYMKTQQIAPVNDWNYIHNLDYLVADCAESGRYQEGLSYAKELQRLGLSPEHRQLPLSGLIPYTGKLSAVKLSMRYGRWSEAAATLVEIMRESADQGEYVVNYYQALQYYLSGMTAVERSDVRSANEAAGRLKAQLWRISKRLGRPKDEADEPFTGTIKLLEIAALELRGSIESIKQAHDKAIKLLEQAVEKEQRLGYHEPPLYLRSTRESLGEAYLRAARWRDAERAYEEVLKQRPNSGHALYGIARAIAGRGDRVAARAAFNKFLTSWQEADEDLPQKVQARAWLAGN